MRLGKCIDLTALTPNLVQGGGATAVWTAISPTHGTCVMTHPPGRDCPGGDPGAMIDPYASISFLFQGCGRIHITASGTGAAATSSPYAFSSLLLRDGTTISSQPNLAVFSGVSGGALCDSTPLSGDDDIIINVTCGIELTLSFDGLYAYRAPASDVTFDVEVYS